MIGRTGLILLAIAALVGSLSCRKEPTKTARAPSGTQPQGQASQTPPTKVGGEQGATTQQPGATAQQPPAGTKPAPGAGTEPNQAGTARSQTPSGQVTPTSTSTSTRQTESTKK